MYCLSEQFDNRGAVCSGDMLWEHFLRISLDFSFYPCKCASETVFIGHQNYNRHCFLIWND